MKKLFTLLLLVIGLGINAQTYFEDSVMPGEFLNDSSPDTGFVFDNLFFPNSFTDCGEDCEFWSGWAISAMTDVTTPGLDNQYSSIVGEGTDGSPAYAVSFAFSGSYVTLDTEQTTGMLTIPSVAITNSTYAYLSMRDGDSVAKKFGGETGDDPDFFLLTIETYSEDVLQETIPFYLADYRFEDNSQDYILDEWIDVPFSNAAVDSVRFSLTSSDVGMFGMNTPAYFCADAFGNTLVLNVKNNTLSGISLVNTLASSELTINSELDKNADYQIFGISGQALQQGKISQGEQYISINNLPVGKYWIRVQQDGLQWTKGFVKQ